MPSCTNTTPTREAKGLLRPALTRQVARLDRDLPVADALDPFVERYWSVAWERPAEAPPFRAEVLSHPCVNLTFETGTEPRFGVHLPAALLHGVVTRRFGVELRGAGRVFGVKFRPGGFVALCGARVARDEVRRLGDELGPDGGRLTGQVLAEGDDRARAALVDAHLARCAAEPDEAYLDLLALVDEMAADRAITRVADVAALAGTSVRGVQRRFDHFLGVTPKWVLRRYRIHDAVALIDEGETDLAGLAAALGWSDQAHFSREFRATVGVTPREYVAREGSHCR